jgi:holo-[acyl-carrier protein] synthase
MLGTFEIVGGRRDILVVGVGIDIVDLEAFRARLDDALIEELFLPGEIAYADSRARPWESLAARFAAKEAAFKALGAGLSQGMRWTDVEVVRHPDGDVNVVFSGAASDVAKRLGVSSTRISLSHSSLSAVAVVIAESEG